MWSRLRYSAARNEDDNPPRSRAPFALKPIAAAGTAVNASFLTFTFLCEGCLDASLGLGGGRGDGMGAGAHGGRETGIERGDLGVP